MNKQAPPNGLFIYSLNQLEPKIENTWIVQWLGILFSPICVGFDLWLIPPPQMLMVFSPPTCASVRSWHLAYCQKKRVERKIRFQSLFFENLYLLYTFQDKQRLKIETPNRDLLWLKMVLKSSKLEILTLKSIALKQRTYLGWLRSSNLEKSRISLIQTGKV